MTQLNGSRTDPLPPAQVSMKLAQQAAQQGDRAAADRHYSDATAADPDHWLPSFSFATWLCGQGRTRQAEELLTAVAARQLQGSPQQKMCLDAIALIRSAAGDRPRDESLLRQQVARDRSDRQAFTELAELLVSQTRMHDLVDLSGEVMELDPDFRDAWGYHAGALNQLGRHQMSRVLCLHLIAKYPDWAYIRLIYGQVLFQLHLLRDAETALAAALTLDPGHAGIHCELGFVTFKRKQPLVAAGHYLNGLRIDRNHANCHFGIGSVLLQTGRLSEAATAFKQAIGSNPFQFQALSGLGIVHQRLGDPFLALHYFSSALAIRPGFAEAHAGLGDAYDKIGAPDLAEAAYREAQRCTPSYVYALTRLVDLLQRLGRTAEAEQVKAQMTGFTDHPSLQMAEEIDAGFEEIGALIQRYGQILGAG